MWDFLCVTFNSRFLNEICEKYSSIHTGLQLINILWYISFYIPWERGSILLHFFNAISDEIRSETINSTTKFLMYHAAVLKNTYIVLY
jgi:hypothetical protein